MLIVLYATCATQMAHRLPIFLYSRALSYEHFKRNTCYGFYIVRSTGSNIIPRYINFRYLLIKKAHYIG